MHHNSSILFIYDNDESRCFKKSIRKTDAWSKLIRIESPDYSYLIPISVTITADIPFSINQTFLFLQSYALYQTVNRFDRLKLLFSGLNFHRSFYSLYPLFFIQCLIYHKTES